MARGRGAPGVLLGLLAAHAGCAPVPSASGAMRAVCAEGAPLSAACEAQIAEDFGVEAEGWPTEGGVTREALLLALHQLADAPLGRRAALAPGGFVDPAWAPWLARAEADAPNTPISELIYDLAANDIARIEPVEETGGAFLARWSADGTVGVAVRAAPLEADELAAILVHETRHATGPGHVPCEAEPDRYGCDRDHAGAFGFQAAWWAMQVPHLADPLAASRAEAFAWESVRRIEPR